jgi:hypothetical protein
MVRDISSVLLSILISAIGAEPKILQAQYLCYNMRLHDLTAASMQMIAFCDVASCSLVEVDRRFRGAYCPHHQDDEAGGTQF